MIYNILLILFFLLLGWVDPETGVALLHKFELENQCYVIAEKMLIQSVVIEGTTEYRWTENGVYLMGEREIQTVKTLVRVADLPTNEMYWGRIKDIIWKDENAEIENKSSMSNAANHIVTIYKNYVLTHTKKIPTEYHGMSLNLGNPIFTPFAQINLKCQCTIIDIYKMHNGIYDDVLRDAVKKYPDIIIKNQYTIVYPSSEFYDIRVKPLIGNQEKEITYRIASMERHLTNILYELTQLAPYDTEIMNKFYGYLLEIGPEKVNKMWWRLIKEDGLVSARIANEIVNDVLTSKPVEVFNNNYLETYLKSKVEKLK